MFRPLATARILIALGFKELVHEGGDDIGGRAAAAGGGAAPASATSVDLRIVYAAALPAMRASVPPAAAQSVIFKTGGQSVVQGTTPLATLLARVVGAMAVDDLVVQHLSGSRLPVSQQLLDAVARDGDSGIAALFRGDTGKMELLLYGDPATVLEAASAASFARAPAIGSISGAPIAFDSSADAVGGFRFANGMRAVATVIRQLRTAAGMTARSAVLDTNAEACVTFVTAATNSVREQVASAAVDARAVGALPPSMTREEETRLVIELLTPLLRTGHEEAAAAARDLFLDAGGGPAGLDAVRTGGGSAYPPLRISPVAAAAALVRRDAALRRGAAARG